LSSISISNEYRRGFAQGFHQDIDARVSIDRSTGDYESFRRWTIVLDEEHEEPAHQIAITDAAERDPDLKVGDIVRAGAGSEIRTGNVLPLRSIPVGTTIHCVEMMPGKGAQIARSAGASVQLLAREGIYAQLRLRSGEIRKVHVDCRATIGTVGNEEHSLRSIGKAGAQRWRGIRPTVRGIAMNPVDHPHGGRSNGGGHPVSPWGTPTKGYQTRKNKRTDGMIIRRRHAVKKG